jgi:molybdopterin converting factor small subunit
VDVRVRVPNQLRDLVAGAAVVEVTVAAGDDGETTVAAVLDALAVSHPALERRVRDELGRTRQHVNVFVGSDNVRDRDGLATPIVANGEVTILPAVSGGCAPPQPGGATRSAPAGTRS